MSSSDKRNKFCSRTCAASYNNRVFPKRVSDRNKVCEVCSTPFYARSAGQRCCYRGCASILRETEREARILKGLLSDPLQLKAYLRKKAGAKCSICFLETWRGQPVLLILDHINGHSEDNSLTNLRLVCPNCDAQLPTFKSRNRGNGRKGRRLNNT